MLSRQFKDNRNNGNGRRSRKSISQTGPVNVDMDIMNLSRAKTPPPMQKNNATHKAETNGINQKSEPIPISNRDNVRNQSVTSDSTVLTSPLRSPTGRNLGSARRFNMAKKYQSSQKCTHITSAFSPGGSFKCETCSKNTSLLSSSPSGSSMMASVTTSNSNNNNNSSSFRSHFDRFIPDRTQSSSTHMTNAFILGSPERKKRALDLVSPSKSQANVPTGLPRRRLFYSPTRASSDNSASTSAGNSASMSDDANSKLADKVYSQVLRTELLGIESLGDEEPKLSANMMELNNAESTHNDPMEDGSREPQSMHTKSPGTSAGSRLFSFRNGASRTSPSSISGANILRSPSNTSSQRGLLHDGAYMHETYQFGEAEKKLVENSYTSPDSMVVDSFYSPTKISLDPHSPLYSTSPITAKSQRTLQSPRKPVRYISKAPFKVLDAPDLADDFYLNLLDWNRGSSSTGEVNSSDNILSVGLGSNVYLWNAANSRVTQLCDVGEYDSVTSVCWMQNGTNLAVGTNRGMVQIWDASSCTRISTLSGHSSRVGAMSSHCGNVFASGSRDRQIYVRDLREPQSRAIARLGGHRQEVCGLRWSPDGQMLASGGNDNNLLVWNKASMSSASSSGLMSNITSPMYCFSDHNAAVKALAWSPHHPGLLVSGGGTADRRIRFWNASTGASLACFDTGSQVCNLVWSRTSNELVSTHGYSQNQIVVWKYQQHQNVPSIRQMAVLTGHTYRVLYLALSPDNQTIVTGAGDETLRFWQVFAKVKDRTRNEGVLDVEFNSLR